MKRILCYFKDNMKILVNDLKNKETRIKQVPNLLTLSRLLSPLIVIPLVLTGNLLLAGIFVGLFSLTDLFDGKIARKYGVSSEFGRLLDACTDKVFAFSLIFPLIFINKILLINLILENVIGLINIKSDIKNNNPRTIIVGKIKTAFLFSLIALSYLSSIIDISVNLVLPFSIMTTILQTTCVIKYKSIDKEKDKKIEIKQLKNNDNKKIKQLEIEKKRYQDLKKYVIECKNNNISEEKINVKVLKK